MSSTSNTLGELQTKEAALKARISEQTGGGTRSHPRVADQRWEREMAQMSLPELRQELAKVQELRIAKQEAEARGAEAKPEAIPKPSRLPSPFTPPGLRPRPSPFD